jgi:hypothetical protein
MASWSPSLLIAMAPGAKSSARRQLSQEQKRQLVADQLRETPERSNRWVGKQLGVHHATVASVRAEMEGTGQIDQLERTTLTGNTGPRDFFKTRPSYAALTTFGRSVPRGEPASS